LRPQPKSAIWLIWGDTGVTNEQYARIVDVSEYRVRPKRGDFEAIISEELFY
jgi:hypothetical protein